MAAETAGLMSEAGMGLGPAERRLLAGMPLHAITSVHGEAGLRERPLMEIAQFPAADRGRAADALALASRLHAADWRQREPYANHLLRVTIRILSHYRVTDPDVACAALLHDAVEDPASDIAPAQQAALTVLAGRFGGRAAAFAAAVTNPEWEPGRDEHEQCREHVLASLEASPWARDQSLRLHRKRGGHYPHHRPQDLQARRQVRPTGPGAARAHPAPGYPAGR